MMTTGGMVEARLVQSISSHTADVLTCCFSGKLLATGSADRLIRLWNVEAFGESFSEIPQSPLVGHSYPVNFCHFTPMGTLLASCSQDGRAIIWDTRTGKKVCQFEHASKGSLRVCQFSHNAKLLATAGDDETIVLWDLQTRRYIRSLEGHEASVVAVGFSPDSSYLISGSNAGDLKLWDVRYGGNGRHLANVPEAHDLGVTAAQFSPSIGAQGPPQEIGGGCMYLLATGGNDNLVKIWRVSCLSDENVFISLYTTLTGHCQNVMCLAFNPCGNYLASGSGDKSVIIWDPIKGEKLTCIDHHERYVTCCAFSSDGILLATGSNDKSIAIFRVGDSRELEGEKPLIDLESLQLEDAKCDTKSVASWTPEDVSTWLSTVGLEEFGELFVRNAIDGKEVFHLHDSMLQNSLGIKALGHRNKILRAVKLLRDMSSKPVASALRRQDGDFPEEYCCPITRDLMVDPVIAADGYSYERAAFCSWIDSGKRRSPMTNAPLPHLDITPNRNLKMIIAKSFSQS